MAVDGSYVFHVLQVIFQSLESRDFMYLSRRHGVAAQLDMLKTDFRYIQKDLIHLERHQPHYEAATMKLWLDDLLDLAYDLDDMVDGFATDMLGRKLVAQHYFSISKVRSLILDCFTYSTPNIGMMSKIEDIACHLKKFTGTTAPLRFPKLPPSLSLSTHFCFHGRDADKAKILEMVLSEESSYISIVGMGGIGKTSLVVRVYSDRALDGFNIRAWVTVSYGSNIQRICEQLLEAIALSPCTFDELEEALIELRNTVIGKKFLFVLDDVWIENDHDWELLGTTFVAGAAGSKIIVTTRNVAAALTMQPSICYNLNLLTKDACWAIFEFMAGGINPQLISPQIREKVVEKIQGLPLAARTLGRMLCCEKRNEWENILNEERFNFSYESEIIRVLEISYTRLPSHVKGCLTYCAILPKDYEFEEKELVLLWAANGLILSPYGGQKTLKDVGSEYFKALLERKL